MLDSVWSTGKTNRAQLSQSFHWGWTPPTDSTAPVCTGSLRSPGRRELRVQDRQSDRSLRSDERTEN